MKPKIVTLLTRFSWAGISTSVINTALYWESRGYLVEIIAVDSDPQQFPFPDFSRKRININLVSFGNVFSLNAIIFTFKKRAVIKDSEFIIAFDVGALLLAGCLCVPDYRNVIYHSLEFFEPRINSIKDRIKKLAERYLSNKLFCVFVQDSFRENYLRLDLRVNKFQHIYNSPTGEKIASNSNFFRNKFNIDKDKTIVLCVGSLIPDHYLVELLNSLPYWSPSFVLVLHGWFPDKTIRVAAEKLINEFPGKLYISTSIFENSDKFIPYQACDILFVGFSSNSNNTKFAAGSAGKIFDAMKAGKPIIAFETPGMRSLIEGNGMGFVFSNPNDINSNLNKIIGSYSQLCEASHFAYEKYEFKTQYDKAMSYLSRMI